jgi:hypothetical protein
MTTPAQALDASDLEATYGSELFAFLGASAIPARKTEEELDREHLRKLTEALLSARDSLDAARKPPMMTATEAAACAARHTRPAPATKKAKMHHSQRYWKNWHATVARRNYMEISVAALEREIEKHRKHIADTYSAPEEKPSPPPTHIENTFDAMAEAALRNSAPLPQLFP